MDRVCHALKLIVFLCLVMTMAACGQSRVYGNAETEEFPEVPANPSQNDTGDEPGESDDQIRELQMAAERVYDFWSNANYLPKRVKEMSCGDTSLTPTSLRESFRKRPRQEVAELNLYY